jgi:chemotaxis signal transduction protein
MTSERKAWLLDLGQGRFAAVSLQVLMEFVRASALLRLPKARKHLAGVMEWRGRLVPVADLNALVDDTDSIGKTDAAAVVILAYQERRGAVLHYGGLRLQSQPKEVWVSDALACALPPESAWQGIAASCFTHEGTPVPILDVRTLFGKSEPYNG